MRRDAAEMKCYGWNACDALFQHRRFDIIRVYVTEQRISDCGQLLKWCVGNRMAYHVVDADELERVAATQHHEGITILARVPRRLSADEAVRLLRREAGPTLSLFLDDVQNPHNVGSITRTAAHFGVGLIAGGRGRLPAASGALFRTAQGACEHVRFAEVESPLRFLRSLQGAGFRVFVTSSHGGHGLYGARLPERAVFVLGNELRGVSKPLAAAADETVMITGTGRVESLNVAITAALVAGEFHRQHPPPPAGP
ncbi:MAG: rRNA methyltransferase [Planctomycetes bacterium]|nr:rRNA methyltransferase [Planctomycetota bacterium]